VAARLNRAFTPTPIAHFGRPTRREKAEQAPACTKNAQQRKEVPDKRVISLLLFKIIFTLLKG